MKKLSFILFAFLLFCANAFAQNGNADKALTLEDKIDAEIVAVTEAIRLNPNDAQLYLKRAHFYRLRQNSEAVASDVTKAIGISPNDVTVKFAAVRALYEFPNRCTQALAIINQAIADNPKSDEAFEWRFRVKTCLNDLVGALEDINTAISLNPKNSIHRTNQALLQQRLAQSENSAESFRKLIASLEEKLKTATDKQEIDKLGRELMMNYISRSKVFARDKNVEAAFADLNRAVEVYPHQYSFWTRGRAYRWREMYPEAINDLTKALELNADEASVLFDRAEIYFLTKKFPEAIADYERIIKNNNGFEKEAERRIAEAKQKCSKTRISRNRLLK